MMSNQNEQTDDDFLEPPDNVEHVEDSFDYFDEEHENDWALSYWFTVDKKGVKLTQNCQIWLIQSA